jgi:hypothetical protein
MPIGFRSSTSGDLATAPATCTVSLPAGTTSGDVTVCVIFSGASNNTPATYPTAPPGWISAGSLANQANGFSHISGYAYVSASPTTATLGFARGTGVGTTGWVTLTFTGVDLTTPIDATGTPNSSARPTSAR